MAASSTSAAREHGARMTCYYLRNHEPLLATDDDPAFYAWFKQKDLPGYPDNRTVARWAYRGIEVSTVFLLYGSEPDDDGRPALFETMVFSAGHPEVDEMQVRYHTYAAAAEGHELVVMDIVTYLSIQDRAGS